MPGSVWLAFREPRIAWRRLTAMQPVSWSHRLARVGTVWLVVAATALAGCSAASNVALPGAGPLVTVSMRGGMCPEAMCESSVILERDGRVHSAAKPPNEIGRVSADAYAALDLAIRSTDFAAMRAKPFAGECPMAFDGQELVFAFAVGASTERLASCETEIDWGSPLLIAVAGALGEWIAIPLT
jgi:hypothetical protein